MREFGLQDLRLLSGVGLQGFKRRGLRLKIFQGPGLLEFLVFLVWGGGGVRVRALGFKAYALGLEGALQGFGTLGLKLRTRQHHVQLGTKGETLRGTLGVIQGLYETRYGV